MLDRSSSAFRPSAFHPLTTRTTTRTTTRITTGWRGALPHVAKTGAYLCEKVSRLTLECSTVKIRKRSFYLMLMWDLTLAEDSLCRHVDKARCSADIDTVMLSGLRITDIEFAGGCFRFGTEEIDSALPQLQRKSRLEVFPPLTFPQEVTIDSTLHPSKPVVTPGCLRSPRANFGREQPQRIQEGFTSVGSTTSHT